MTIEVYIALLVAMFVFTWMGLSKLDNKMLRKKRSQALADIEKEKLRNK